MIDKGDQPRGSQARKRRGRQTEHEVAKAFAADGWPYALATGAGTPGRDITGVPGVYVEVKARSRFEPMANLRQTSAGAASSEIRAIIMRPNGAGPASINDWPAFLTFAQLRWLLRAAGYGEPLPGADGLPPP